MSDDAAKIPFRKLYRDFCGNGRTFYSVNAKARTQDQYLEELAAVNPDIDWPRYQELFDEKHATTKWQPFRIHRWLKSRKHLWRLHRAMPLDHEAMKEAEQAFAQLPDEGPADKDINWVKTHPRVFRIRQIGADADDGADVALTAEDILKSCNGPAPSKSAVTMLQEALANLNKFWAAILSEQKKSTTKAASSEGADDVWGDEATDDDDLFDEDDDQNDDETI